MKYFTPKLQPMQESGAALLRSMQNMSMVPLDLLVREAVQNSLDAALEDAGGEVHVDFTVRAHKTEPVVSLLGEHINKHLLREKFPKEARMLEIRDSHTEGLSGATSMDGLGPRDSHGNLLKLVFEVGRTRSNEGAGGSWGLGKTCYFRMGVGLVFYYSRTLSNGLPVERLVACIVEDENGAERLQTSTSTGIGWWGEKGPEQGPAAIIDTVAIRRILTVFGVKPFRPDETGTAIIIPFLSRDLIAVPAVEEDIEVATTSKLPAWWFENYEQYIEVALQRWFCVRIDNPMFRSGPWLHASVNGKKLCREEMLPVFQVTQSLYNRIGTETRLPGDYLGRKRVALNDVLCQPVPLNNVFETPGPAGHVAAVVLTARQLGIGPPDNVQDPYLCLYGKPEKSPPFRPIVTFMRSPGMSIRWDDSSSGRGWARGVKGATDGKYMVALFVPEPERRLAASLREKLRQADGTVESYLRSCELSDHHQWADLAGHSIAERIRSGVSKRLRDHVMPTTQNTTQGISIGLARNLANLLLPQRGLGLDGRNGRASPGEPSPWTKTLCRNRNAKPKSSLQFRVTDQKYGRDRITVDWLFDWGKGDDPREITLSVDSERGPVTEHSWNDSGLGAFPFRLTDISIEQISPNAGARVPLRIEQKGNGCLRLLPDKRSKQAPDDLTLQGSFSIVFPDPGSRDVCPLIEALIVAKGSV